MPLRTIKHFIGCAAAMAALVLSCGLLRAGEPKNHFRKEIKLPELKEKQLVAISPDADLFYRSCAGMGDLRVVDEGGWPQPVTDRLVEIPTPLPGGGPRVSDQKSISHPDGTVEVRFRVPTDAEVPPGQRIDKTAKILGINIHTLKHSFEVSAKLFGLAANGDRTLLGEGEFADYNGFFPLSRMHLPAQLGNYPEYLLILGRPTLRNESELVGRTLDWGTPVVEESIRDRTPLKDLSVSIAVEGHQTQPGPKYAFTSPRSFKVTQDPGTAATIVDVEASGESMVAIIPKFAQKEYFRTCKVYVDRSGGEGTPAWSEAGKEFLRKIHYKELTSETTEIPLNGNVARKIRLKIDNAYLPALDIVDVEFKIPAREFVFFAKPGQKLWVEYGDKTWTERGEYAEEVHTLLAQKAIPAVATLGPEEAWESRTPVSYWDTIKQPRVLGGIGLGCMMVFVIYKQLAKLTLKSAV